MRTKSLPSVPIDHTNRGPNPLDSGSPAPPVVLDEVALQALAARIATIVIDEISRRMRVGGLTLEPAFMSAKDVSALTGVSEKSLESMRAARQGPPCFRLGRRIRYEREAVLQWAMSDPVR